MIPDVVGTVFQPRRVTKIAKIASERNDVWLRVSHRDKPEKRAPAGETGAPSAPGAPHRN